MSVGEARVTPWRVGLSLVAFVLFVVAANIVGNWIVDLLKIELTPRNEPMIHRLIMWSVGAYGILVALPFVPGLELAIGILMVAGPGIVPLLYAVTVVGLLLSFLVGCSIPLRWLKAACGGVRLKRLGRLIGEMEVVDRHQKLELLLARAPTRFLPFLLRHRYLAIGVLLNVPGNIVIGGGGGLALMAGLSKLYSPPAFLLTLLIAIAPVPLAIFLFGHEFLIG